MPLGTRIALAALLLLGLAACDDKQAQNNTPRNPTPPRWSRRPTNRRRTRRSARRAHARIAFAPVSGVPVFELAGGSPDGSTISGTAAPKPRAASTRMSSRVSATHSAPSTTEVRNRFIGHLPPASRGAVAGRALLLGPALGAITVGFGRTYLSEQFPTQWTYFLGLLFVLVILLLPRGVGDLPRALRAGLRGRSA